MKVILPSGVIIEDISIEEVNQLTCVETKKSKHIKYCAICGKKFENPSFFAKYCPECRRPAKLERDKAYNRAHGRKRKAQTRRCVICGSRLGKSKHKFCSEKCHKIRIRERTKELYRLNADRVREQRRVRYAAKTGKTDRPFHITPTIESD